MNDPRGPEADPVRRRMPLAIRTPQHACPLGTVLGVWADPDDETYLSSGLVALRRRAGRTLFDAIGEDRFAAWWRNETFWSPGSIAP